MIYRLPLEGKALESLISGFQNELGKNNDFAIALAQRLFEG